jgi:photosystem II stability/assembly factor-like uncharacterized protein
MCAAACASTVYGFGSDWETREARFLRSDDRGRRWTQLAPPEGLLGLALDPQDARISVALGERRGYLSTNGGASWRPLAVPGGMVTWTPELGLIAVDLDGMVRHATEPTGEWSEVGRLPGTPAALEGVGDELLAATHDSRVLSSHDGGNTWRRPPQSRLASSTPRQAPRPPSARTACLRNSARSVRECCFGGK